MTFYQENTKEIHEFCARSAPRNLLESGDFLPRKYKGNTTENWRAKRAKRAEKALRISRIPQREYKWEIGARSAPRSHFEDSEDFIKGMHDFNLRYNMSHLGIAGNAGIAAAWINQLICDSDNFRSCDGKGEERDMGSRANNQLIN